jgi:glycine dehydrogenase
VYPVPGLVGRGYLSPVRRIDQAYGDRNLVCSCPPPEAFAEHDFTAHEASADGDVPGRGAGAPDDLGTTADVVASSA